MTSHLLYIDDKIKTETGEQTAEEGLQQWQESQHIFVKTYYPFRVEIVSLKW